MILIKLRFNDKKNLVQRNEKLNLINKYKNNLCKKLISLKRNNH